MSGLLKDKDFELHMRHGMGPGYQTPIALHGSRMKRESGLGWDELVAVNNLPVGGEFKDHEGDLWKRTA